MAHYLKSIRPLLLSIKDFPMHTLACVSWQLSVSHPLSHVLCLVVALMTVWRRQLKTLSEIHAAQLHTCNSRRWSSISLYCPTSLPFEMCHSCQHLCLHHSYFFPLSLYFTEKYTATYTCALAHTHPHREIACVDLLYQGKQRETLACSGRS